MGSVSAVDHELVSTPREVIASAADPTKAAPMQPYLRSETRRLV